MLTIDHDRRAVPRPASASRRTRPRLRELCDEVLASYRAARGREPIGRLDRDAARVLLRRLTPALSP